MTTRKLSNKIILQKIQDAFEEGVKPQLAGKC